MTYFKKLTDEEKKELDDLPMGFNIQELQFDEDMEFGKKIYISRYWTEKILKMSMVLIVASFIFFFIGFIFFVNKPKPHVYGSSSDNSLIILNVLERDEALAAINMKALEREQNQETTTNQEAENNNNTK